jgi:polysaccharide biosynthesis transport protein
MTPGVTPEVATLPAAWVQPGIRPSQLLAVLGAYRAIILKAALVGGVTLALLALFVLPKRYESTAVVLVDFEVNNPISGREFPSQLAASYLSTQQAIIESGKVMLPVVDRLGWATDERRTRGYREQPGGVREWLAWKVLAPSLTVKTYKDTRLIDITAQDRDPQVAAQVANTVAHVFIESQTQSSGADAKARAQEYTTQLEGLRNKLTEAQKKLADFRSQTGLLEFDPVGGVDSERLAALNSVLTAQEAESRAIQARAATARRDGVDAGTLDSGLVQALKSRVLELEGRFAELSRELGPRHPDYIAVQRQLEDARAALARETSQYARVLQGSASSAGHSEAALRREVDEQRKRLLAIREQQDQASLLVRDVEAAKKVYDDALSLYDRAVAPSQSQFSNSSLVSEAAPALHASRPKVLASALLGLVGGTVLAALACLFWEFTHRRVRCADDLRDALGDAPLIVLEPGV